MSPDGRVKVLGSPLALALRAIAGSTGAKALEVLTLAGIVLLVPRALGAADYGGFAVASAIAMLAGVRATVAGTIAFAARRGDRLGADVAP